MKRVILLTLIVVTGVAGFLSVSEVSPFTPPVGSNLESALRGIFQGGVTTALLVIAFILFVLLLFSREIARDFKRLTRTAENPAAEENRPGELSLSRRFEFTENALLNFADAMQNYAGHMASHTSAIRGLSEASQALKGSAAEQNRILGHLSKSIIRDRINREISIMERLVSEIEKKTTNALRARDELEHGATDYIIEEIPVRKEIAPPPGCVVNPKALSRRRY